VALNRQLKHFLSSFFILVVEECFTGTSSRHSKNSHA